MLKKVNESKRTIRILLGAIFVVALILNMLTPLFVDDFTYLNSFATGERITSIREIFPSMKAHYFVQNGRIVVHFFSQLFLLFPPIVFDLINAGMFVLQIALIYYYCKTDHDDNAFLLLVIAGFIWKCVPAFGQVYLWLSGACNYLWSVDFSMLYILPFVFTLKGKKVLKSKWSQILYILSGVVVGALLESISFGNILISLMCIVLIRFYRKQKCGIWLYISVCTQSLGYIFMMSSPATNEYKVAKGAKTYLYNFLDVLEQYKEIALGLFVLWLSLIIISYYAKVSKKIMAYSGVCMIVSLVLNFIHIPASYYPYRSMLGSVLFLIMAICCLISGFWNMKLEVLSTSIGMIVILLAVIDFFPGVYDVASTYHIYKSRESYIEEQRKDGVEVLELHAIWPETKYSGVWGIREIDLNADVRPNTSMALYYGVDSIVALE